MHDNGMAAVPRLRGSCLGGGQLAASCSSLLPFSRLNVVLDLVRWLLASTTFHARDYYVYSCVLLCFAY